LPPAVAAAAITGSPAAVEKVLAAAHLPTGADVWAPIPVETDPAPGKKSRAETTVRVLVRAAMTDRSPLTAALHAAVAVVSAANRSGRDGSVRVQVDPRDIG
jgi:hypothetical protein